MSTYEHLADTPQTEASVETTPSHARTPTPLEEKVGAAWHAAKMSSVGIEMAIATGIGWFMGYWLDGKLGTGPWLMLVFLGCGIAAGFRGVLRAGREARAHNAALDNAALDNAALDASTPADGASKEGADGR